MKRYKEYRNSDISWLEEIPNHWNVKIFKQISYMKGRIGWQGLKFAEFSDNLNLPYLITGMNFKDGKIRWDEVYHISEERYNEAPEIKLKHNDILMTKDGTIGKLLFVDYLPGKASINSHLLVLRNIKNSYYPRYMFYQLSSQNFIGHIENNKYGTTFFGLTQEAMGRFKAIVPPYKEQIQITNYLDAKTQAIDKKIRLLTNKIEYYKELRKSFINNAVTKGLDKNVNLRESELGFETPVHWKSYRLKDVGYLYSGLSGKAGDDFNQDDNPNNKGFIPFTNIANNTYLKKDHLGTVVVFDNEKQNKVKKGDIFFLMSSEGYDDIGKTAVLHEDLKDTYLNSFCKGYRLTKSFCYPSFVNYLLLSANYRSLLITEGKGFTRINLKMEKVTDFIVYLPPTKQEQSEIATYLDAKTSTIDKICTNLQTQIETLKELRKTLINDVVTGKVKVTE